MTYNKGIYSLFITDFVTQDFVWKILLQTISILCCNMYTYAYIIIFVTELFLTHTVTNVYYSIYIQIILLLFVKEFHPILLFDVAKDLFCNFARARHYFGKELKALKIPKLITCPS